MKRLAIWTIGFAALFFGTGTSRAQNAASSGASDPATSSFPVVPLTVNLERIPQLLRVTLDPSRGPWYSSVEAEVDSNRNPAWYQVILREAASGKQIYYCNSQNTVNVWKGLGLEAYYTPIQFNSSQGPDSHMVYQLQMQDATGQAIDVQFNVGDSTTDLFNGSQFMPRPDDYGLVLLRGEQNFHAAPGSTVTIAGHSYPAANNSFYSSGVIIADIQPVTEQWNLTNSPAQLHPGDKWGLRSTGGRDEALTIQQANGNSLVIDATEPNFPNGANIRMDVERSANQYVLNSLTVMAESHTFRIAFNPALPLPAPMTQDQTPVGFTMAEDNDPNVASGRVLVRRGMGDEHLDWTFASPNWAKPVQLTTGVSVLAPGATQALKKSTPGVP